VVAHRNLEFNVPVEPGRKYCFLVRGTDGKEVYYSAPKPIRGAVCRE
jgi:eukaryotic-like serine/threonine-protein kinase